MSPIRMSKLESAVRVVIEFNEALNKLLPFVWLS